jgi:predicted regulator of Ras-like GTPase activity (Roadblock/LC7/MglB family)
VDGLPLVSKSNVDTDEEKISAVSSLVMSSLEKVAGDLALGEFENAVIRSKDGVVFIYDLDKEGTLVAVADKSVKLGLALYELKKAAADVKQVLKSTGSSATAGESV